MMGIIAIKIIVLLLMLFITLFASMMPLIFVHRIRQIPNLDLRIKYQTILSLLNCFAGGVFMGTCILDLFPDVQKQIDALLQKYPPSARAFPVAEFIVVFGFLFVLTIEQIGLWFKEQTIDCNNSLTSQLISSNVDPREEARHNLQREHSLEGVRDRPDLTASMRSTASHHSHYGSVNADDTMAVTYMPEHNHHSHMMPHDTLHSPLRSILLLLALSLHSVFEGLAVGLQESIDNVVALFIIVILHKGVIAFSLGLNMVQSKLAVRQVVLSNVFFSITAPLGLGLGVGISSLAASNTTALVSGALQGIACGTFLFVTFFEVLPHEMNNGHHRLWKNLSVIIGFAAVCAMMYIEPSQRTPGDDNPTVSDDSVLFSYNSLL